ncbi:MAG: thermonuclease family protein [Flavobacteriaceae bacterium]
MLSFKSGIFWLLGLAPALLCLAALSGASPFEPDGQMTGRASVIDGDTIELAGNRIRLAGIDAPEIRQFCLDGEGREYACGLAAAGALKMFLDSASPTSCQARSRDRWGRYVAWCRRADGADAAAYLVRAGQALDWPRYSKGRYRHAQMSAQRARRGVWQGRFDSPWQWRRRR